MILSALTSRYTRLKNRSEGLKRDREARELEALLSTRDIESFLTALGKRYPEAVEPSRDYLSKLYGTHSEQIRFVRTHQRDGRIESFHHFLGALIYPLVVHSHNFGFSQNTTLHVQDCGSLNTHLLWVAECLGLNVTFFPAEIAAPILNCHHEQVLSLPPFDGSNISGKWLLDHEVDCIRTFGDTFAPVEDAEQIPVLLVLRGDSDTTFATTRFQTLYKRRGSWNTTGKGRRHIPNSSEVIQAIQDVIEPHVVFTEEMSFREQILLFRRAQVIVTQHGAALNGMIWCKPGTRILEVLPTDKLGLSDGYFRNMAAALGIRHSFLMQNGPHDPVNAPEIAQYVARNLQV